MTTDHKPSILTERQRIENAGRSVTFTGGASRIDHGIAVSRSIGIVNFYFLWGHKIYHDVIYLFLIFQVI